MILPRPAPISSVSDLLIPATAVLVAWVLSIIWAFVATASSKVLPVHTRIFPKIFMFLLLTLYSFFLVEISRKRPSPPDGRIDLYLWKSEREGETRHLTTEKLCC